jgi:hypothetical protein
LDDNDHCEAKQPVDEKNPKKSILTNHNNQIVASSHHGFNLQPQPQYKEFRGLKNIIATAFCYNIKVCGVTATAIYCNRNLKPC